jgi:hypothetical protein
MRDNSVTISKAKRNYAVRFLVFTGDHTMEVLIWHFLSLKIVSLLLIAIYRLPIKQLSEFPLSKNMHIKDGGFYTSVLV